MKKTLITLAAIASIFTSCASNAGLARVDSVAKSGELDIASLDRKDYTIVGRVSGTATIVAKDSDLAKQNEGKVIEKLINYEGDSLHYGLQGIKNARFMTAQEVAVANAYYNMLKQAQENEADTVVFVNTRVSIIPKISETSGKQNAISPKSNVTATVTGVAIRINGEETVKPASDVEPEDLNPALTFKLKKEAEAKAAREAAEAEKAEKARLAAEAKAKEEAEKAAAAAAKTEETVQEPQAPAEEATEATVDAAVETVEAPAAQ